MSVFTTSMKKINHTCKTKPKNKDIIHSFLIIFDNFIKYKSYKQIVTKYSTPN